MYMGLSQNGGCRDTQNKAEWCQDDKTLHLRPEMPVMFMVVNGCKWGYHSINGGDLLTYNIF
jgi:hypothetical protein